MKRPLEAHDLNPFGCALVEPVLARHLDGQLAGLGARIGEEHRVGKGMFDQPIGQFLLLFNGIQIRHMPELARLIGQRLDQIGVRMAQRVHRDACAHIQKPLPVAGDQPAAFAALETQRRAGVGGQYCRDHRTGPSERSHDVPDRRMAVNVLEICAGSTQRRGSSAGRGQRRRRSDICAGLIMAAA